MAHLRKIYAESIHIQAIKETCKTLAESRQALVHQLQVHEISFQVSHGVGEFSKCGLERRQWRSGRPVPAAYAGTLSQGGP